MHIWNLHFYSTALETQVLRIFYSIQQKKERERNEYGNNKILARMSKSGETVGFSSTKPTVTIDNLIIVIFSQWRKCRKCTHWKWIMHVIYRYTRKRIKKEIDILYTYFNAITSSFNRIFCLIHTHTHIRFFHWMQDCKTFIKFEQISGKKGLCTAST